MQDSRAPIIAFIIQYVSISTIALLVVIVALGDYCVGFICNWVEPINEIEVYVLAIIAGFAGIIGLFIGNPREHITSTIALFIAAMATAIAGYLSIGDNIAGRDIVSALAVFSILSLSAEWIGNRIINLRAAAKSLIVMATVATFIIVISVFYSQPGIEHYFSTWILLPFGIIVINVVICLMYLNYEKVIMCLMVPFIWISSGFRKLAKSLKLTGRDDKTRREDDKSI